MATPTTDTYVASSGSVVHGGRGDPIVVPPPPADGEMFSMSVNPASQVLFEQWSPDKSRYTRSQGVLRLSGPTAKVPIYGYNSASGGTMRAFTGVAYSLLIDGVQKATITPTPGANSAFFTVDATALSPGWHELQVVPTVPGESCIPYFGLVTHGSVAGPSSFIPLAMGSYSLTMSPTVYRWGKAPPTYNPTPKPLVARERVFFDTMIATSQLHVQQLVPLRFGDTNRACITADGAWTSFAPQPYHWHQMHSKYPTVPLLDGPRGVGTVCMLTHIEVGTAAPANLGFINNTYFCDPWRLGKVRENGLVSTLVGYRHKDGYPHYQNPDPADPNHLELVGDWSAIPVERRGFRELWGLAWDLRRSVVPDSFESVPSTDPRERGMNPHKSNMGMVVFLADTMNNRIVKCEFSPTSHFAYDQTKVTEFLTGLGDPWDCVGDGTSGILYVSERTSHRICAYSMDTGQLLRVVVQGQPLATVDVNREVWRLASLDVCRAADCVAPEGLAIMDGWLYWGSKAQAQIKRVNLTTGVIEVHSIVRIDGNSKFCKIAVSDGTFGPRGMVAYATWSNADYGWPAFQTSTSGWGLGGANLNGVMAGFSGHFGYSTAVGIGYGQMIFGGNDEGLLRVTKRLPTDTVASTAAKNGGSEWFLTGHKLLHGASGFGYFGLPLPWGESANIDAFLTHNGHTPP